MTTKKRKSHQVTCPHCHGQALECAFCGGTGLQNRYRLPVDTYPSAILKPVAGCPGLFKMPDAREACPKMDQNHRAMRVGNKIICPGCDRVCELPSIIEAGMLIRVLKRDPKEYPVHPELEVV